MKSQHLVPKYNPDFLTEAPVRWHYPCLIFYGIMICTAPWLHNNTIYNCRFFLTVNFYLVLFFITNYGVIYSNMDIFDSELDTWVLTVTNLLLV